MSAATAAVAADRAVQATSQHVHRCAATMSQAMTRGPAAVGNAVVARANTACEGQHLVGADAADAIHHDGMGDGASACRRGQRYVGASSYRRQRLCGGRWADRRDGSKLTPLALG